MIATNQESYNIICQLCEQEFNIIADRHDVEAWLSGDKNITDALDYLSAAERELLISRICDTCWKELYTLDIEE